MKKITLDKYEFWTIDWEKRLQFSTAEKRIAIYIMVAVVLLTGAWLSHEVVNYQILTAPVQAQWTWVK